MPAMVGSGLTDTGKVAVATQPKLLVTVLVMVAEPADTPRMVPDVLMLAVPAALLLHEPPAVVSESVVLPFTHTDELPVMAPGTGTV
jgi:hypothetical protein